MKKLFSVITALSVLALSGCSFTDIFSSTTTDRPYDSNFKSAEEWAEYWCGPCEELDVVREDGDGGDYYEYHTMKDSEYGFTYTVRVYYHRYGSILNKPYADYSCDDFDLPYMKTFLEETDLSDISEKYDLTIDIGEGDSLLYIAEVNLWTDLLLGKDEETKIYMEVGNKLAEFDTREHFTKNEYCTSVFVNLHHAPTEEEAALGHVYSGGTKIYGYTSGS